MTTMTKGEREDLQRLVRQREKVLTAAARQRSADLLADFENQMAAQYRFDDDAIWAAAAKEAEAVVARAQQTIAARCAELGIPKQFAPSLSLRWNARGYDNLIDKRRAELRTAAKAQIEALERKATVEIQRQSVEAQTELALAGLTSDSARAFIERLPAVDSLMPALSYEELAGDSEPPFVEQLITPSALRQRRYRDRQKALRDGTVTPKLAGKPEPEQTDPPPEDEP